MTVNDKNRVALSDMNVAGDVVGRDKSEVVNNYYLTPEYKGNAALKTLLAEHEKEKETDPSYCEISDELNKFFRKSLNSRPRNLEKKLSDGGRDYLVDAAMEAKEHVAKKIKRYAYYKSAQEIYTYLLANIRIAFLHEVQAKIKSGDFSKYEIDDIVISKIIEPLLYNLDGSSLGIDKHELYGLLYFLTGNCYIEWD